MPIAKNIAYPIAMTGSIVSSEATLKLNAISPRIADNNGPTAAIDGRRLRPTKTMPSMSQVAGRAVMRTFSMFRP